MLRKKLILPERGDNMKEGINARRREERGTG